MRTHKHANTNAYNYMSARHAAFHGAGTAPTLDISPKQRNEPCRFRTRPACEPSDITPAALRASALLVRAARVARELAKAELLRQNSPTPCRGFTATPQNKTNHLGKHQKVA